MLQEFFTPDFFERYPDHLFAPCSRAQAAQLMRFDHHVIQVQGRPAVMLTYHWTNAYEEGFSGPFPLLALFYHTERHPAAPPEVQALVDQLHFQPQP